MFRKIDFLHRKTNAKFLDLFCNGLRWCGSGVLLVMDHCYYGIHCNIQNIWEPSHWRGLNNVKTPYVEKLQWSPVIVHATTSVTVHWNVTTSLLWAWPKNTFNYLREFLENSPSIQAVTEVDHAGTPVRIFPFNILQCPYNRNCRDNVLARLVRARRFEYVTSGI